MARKCDEEIIRGVYGKALKCISFQHQKSLRYYEVLWDIRKRYTVDSRVSTPMVALEFSMERSEKYRISMSVDGCLKISDSSFLYGRASNFLYIGDNICEYVEGVPNGGGTYTRKATPLGTEFFEDLSMPTFDELELAEMVYPGMEDILFKVNEMFFPTISHFNKHIDDGPVRVLEMFGW